MKTMDQKQLIEKVENMNCTGGGTVEVSVKGISTIMIAQTEWNETPVCFTGGRGNKVYALEPEEIRDKLPSVLTWIFGHSDLIYQVTEY